MALALSTWLFVALHDHPVAGGLPSDFLSRGAPLLLIFDTIQCDSQSLAWEEKFQNSMLSADIFKQLHKHQVIEPVDMRGRVLGFLAEQGTLATAQHAMRQEMLRLRTLKNRGAVRLPPGLQNTNSALFAAIGAHSLSTVLWEGREHYFGRVASSASLEPDARGRTYKLPVRAKGARNYMSVLSAIIPRMPDLIPSLVPGSEQFAARRRNILRESKMVRSHAFGDPAVTMETLLEYRLGKAFRADDHRTDNWRRGQAMKNLEWILKRRSETADIRGGVQQCISDSLKGKNPEGRISRDLNEQLQILLAHHSKTKKSLALSFGTKSLVEITGAFVESLIFPPIGLIRGAAEVVLSAKDAREEWREIDNERRNYPLVHFLQDLRNANDSTAP